MNPKGETYDLMHELHNDIYDKCDLITLTNSRGECEINIRFRWPGRSPCFHSHDESSSENCGGNRQGIGDDPGSGVFGTKVTTKE